MGDLARSFRAFRAGMREDNVAEARSEKLIDAQEPTSGAEAPAPSSGSRRSDRRTPRNTVWPRRRSQVLEAFASSPEAGGAGFAPLARESNVLGAGALLVAIALLARAAVAPVFRRVNPPQWTTRRWSAELITLAIVCTLALGLGCLGAGALAALQTKPSTSTSACSRAWCWSPSRSGAGSSRAPWRTPARCLRTRVTLRHRPRRHSRRREQR
jgi:hypothetical protein